MEEMLLTDVRQIGKRTLLPQDPIKFYTEPMNPLFIPVYNYPYEGVDENGEMRRFTLFKTGIRIVPNGCKMKIYFRPFPIKGEIEINGENTYISSYEIPKD